MEQTKKRTEKMGRKTRAGKESLEERKEKRERRENNVSMFRNRQTIRFQARQWKASGRGSEGSAKKEYRKNYIYSMTLSARKHQTGLQTTVQHQTARKPNI